MPSALNKLSDVSVPIGLCHITVAVPPVIPVLSTVDISIFVVGHSLALSVAFKPLPDIV